MKFKSSHKLKFKTAPHIIGGAPTGLEKYEVGTVHGLWNKSSLSVDIFALINKTPGNGHVDDALEWFFAIAKEGALGVRIVNITAEAFRQTLIAEWGFSETKEPDTLVNLNTKQKKINAKTSNKAG